MTTTVIDQLIRDQQQAQARAREEHRHRLQQETQQAGQDLVQSLTDLGLEDFWTMIAQVGYETKIDTAGAGHPSTGPSTSSGGPSGRRNKQVSQLILHVPLSEDLQLAGFQVHYAPARRTITFTDGRNSWGQANADFTVPANEPELSDVSRRLGAFLHDRRQAYLEYRERQEKEAQEERKEHLRTLQYDLKYYRVETPAKAQQIFDELVKLEPDDEDDWRKALDEWQARHDHEMEKIEKKKQRRAQAEAYEAVYREYYAIVRSIRARNYQRLEELQAELDQPFAIWQLEYGIVAHEEGGSYADTHSVYALEQPPSQPGICRIFAGSMTGVVEKYIYHPVAWRELTTRPTDEKAYKVLTHHDPYFRLVFHPEGNKAEVEAMIAERLEPEPDPPKAGRPLSERDRKRIQDDVKRDLDPDYYAY